MYHNEGMGAIRWGDALAIVADQVAAPGPAAPTTPEYSDPSWWGGALEQVADSAADWVSSEISGVPTYGGAPAYPAGTPGYEFYNAPDAAAGVPVSRAPMMAGAGTALALGAAALIAAKLAGVF